MTDNKEKVDVKENNSLETNLRNEVNYAPFVNVYEEKDDYVLVANMPGVSKDGVKLKVEDSILTISGKTNYNEAVNKKYILNEAEIGNYYRKFKLSNSIDESKIDAKYENGQLTIYLPKHDRIKPRDISIN